MCCIKTRGTRKLKQLNIQKIETQVWGTGKKRSHAQVRSLQRPIRQSIKWDSVGYKG